MVFLIFLFGFFSSFFGAFSALFWSFMKNKKYWRNKKVAYKEPQFLAGNFAEAGTKNLGIIFRELYEEAKSEKIFGIWQFTMPVLLVVDLELVKKILVTDFLHFDDHGVYFNKETDPLAVFFSDRFKNSKLKEKIHSTFDGKGEIYIKSAVYRRNEDEDHKTFRLKKTKYVLVNLLTMGGYAWRNLRIKLNPAFTVGKLKMMFPIMLDCGKQLTQILRSSAEKQEVVEFKDLFARFTTDVISSCAFGIETNSLNDERAIFRIMGKKVFQSSWEVICRNFVGFLFPDFARLFKVRIYPKELTEFFIRVIRETMNYRESNNVKRNDILQMLIQLKNEGFISAIHSEDKQSETSHIQEEKKEKFSCEQVAAQAFIFFTAGFETSSTTMQYALYELAMNPYIQDRVRAEMQHVISKSRSLSYDAIQEMTYLGWVLDETLRKYPPATNLNRMCTKEYKIPGTDIILDKGTQISVSVLGLHWDDRYYPDPEKFDPDRFSEDQKSSRPPYSYMPFGEGPRTCIGQRFGLTQAKIGLISILSNYEVSIAKSITQIPPIYDPKSFFSAPKGGMHLKISLLPKGENRRFKIKN